MFLYNEIKLDAPVNLVFDFLSKFENIPLWNYYVMNVWQDNGEQGTLYHQIRKNDQQTFIVVEESKPNRIKIETTNQKGIRFSRLFQIKQISKDECVLEDHFEMDLRQPKFIQNIFKPNIKKAVEENLLKLKQLLENGVTVLQDGRKSYLIKNKSVR